MGDYRPVRKLDSYDQIEENYTYKLKRLKQEEKYLRNEIKMKKEKLKQQEDLVFKYKRLYEIKIGEYHQKGKKTYYQYFPGAQKYLVRELKDMKENVEKEEIKEDQIKKDLELLNNRLYIEQLQMKRLEDGRESKHKKRLCKKIGQCNIMYKDINVKLKF